MNNNPMTCDPERIELFLRQELSDEAQTAFELHLDDCNDCRHRLEATAAGDDIWSGVRDSLRGQQLPSDCLPPGDSPLDSARSGDAPFSHGTVLKLLAPTDDDRMIGRLGTYEVVGIIGSGGMGIVLKAFDAALNRYVAIKVLAPHLGSSGAARKRFSREAQAAAAVVHDNVIEIHGVADTDGLPYLVMSYVRGPSLQRRLDDAGPLALVEILRIGMQAATGLAAAHAQGLVHRDVKPANILLADGVERVKLTDFGLARAADDASLTRSGTIAGTPQYMSPEQARGESVDQKSDLFSLGSVLYAMCTGHTPFRAETSYGVLRRITDEEPRPIRKINPNIPEWLCRLIARLMAKQPGERFDSADEVAELLEKCLAHVQQPTVVPLPASLMTQPKDSRFSSLSRHSSKVIATTVASVFGLLGMFLWQSTRPPDISGRWDGDDWGQVVLEETRAGHYDGTYTDTFGEENGTLQFRWSRIERRFNGTWREGKDRDGKISVRRVGDEIRGAWTTSRESRINPGTPDLADLLWVRPRNGDSVKAAARNQLIGLWRVMLPKKDGTLVTNPERILISFDSWRIALEHENEEDNENFFYRLLPGNVIQMSPVNATWDDKTLAGRYRLIDHNNMWIAISAKSHPKPPLSAEPTTPDENVNYLRLVRVQNEQNGADLGQKPANNLDSSPNQPRPAGQHHRREPTVVPGHHSRYFRNLGDGTGVPYVPDLGPASGETERPSSSNRPEVVYRRLSDVIGEFNQRHKQHPIGKDQPPLTDDEVVASIRWAANVNKPQAPELSDEHLRQLREIAEKHSLVNGWKFELVTQLDGVDQERFQVWSIRLVLDRRNGKKYSHIIRNQLLWQLDADGKPEKLSEPDAAEQNAFAKPLATAIHGFNSAHRSLGGRDQPPLTEREVVAAIRWYKSRRNEVDMTNGEFAAFQKIAESRQFPPGAEFEIIKNFQPGDGFDYLIWSVRLNLPRLVVPTPNPHYGIILRTHYAQSRPIDNGNIFWGAVAANGLQAGVRFEPRNEQYVVGQQVTPRFFYRNRGDQQTEVSFPRVMTRGYYDEIIAVDATGLGIPIDQETKPAGPVGWIEIPFGFGAQHEVRGLPIVLGDVARGEAETVIRAKPGQTVRIRFALPNYAQEDAKPLQTGEILFSIAQDNVPESKQDSATRATSRDTLIANMQGDWIVEAMNDGFEDSLNEMTDRQCELIVENTLLKFRFYQSNNPDTLRTIPLSLNWQKNSHPEWVEVIIDPNGNADRFPGVLKCDGKTLQLCMSNQGGSTVRPRFIAPGGKVFYYKCRRRDENDFVLGSSHAKK